MKINLKHHQTGLIKQAPVGFSWTTLFFGFLVPAFRSHWGACFLMLAVHICTLGLSQIYFAFTYNKKFINHLVDSGFVPNDDANKESLRDLGIKFAA